MSRAAKELAAKLTRDNREDAAAIDEAVKPLASAAEAFAIHGTAENAERLWKALEPWRQES